MQKLHDDHGFEIIELQFLYDVLWLSDLKGMLHFEGILEWSRSGGGSKIACPTLGLQSGLEALKRGPSASESLPARPQVTRLGTLLRPCREIGSLSLS